MKILAVDTSCDETAAAVTDGTQILSNVVWSQASQHAKWGGVVPSVAQRQHEERIDWVIEKAIKEAQRYRGAKVQSIDAVAVTAGPGLAIALGVGIERARRLAIKLNKPLIAVNHIEGHVLSALALPIPHPHPSPNLGEGRNLIQFPALGIVVSGKHTDVILIEEIGKYKILASTVDDALGEALDKAARMLGLGYPGGAVLEKMAKLGDPKKYLLPRPMAGREDQGEFSYSGLKTAMHRQVAEVQRIRGAEVLEKQDVCDLAAAFQWRAFEHLIRITRNSINTSPLHPSPIIGEGTVGRGIDLLVGGGVAANVELRKQLRRMARELGLKIHFPYSKKLYGDNAAMIGVAAGFKYDRGEFISPDKIDRRARWRIDEL